VGACFSRPPRSEIIAHRTSLAGGPFSRSSCSSFCAAPYVSVYLRFGLLLFVLFEPPSHSK